MGYWGVLHLVYKTPLYIIKKEINMVFPFLSQTTDFISKFDIFVNVLKKIRTLIYI